MMACSTIAFGYNGVCDHFYFLGEITEVDKQSLFFVNMLFILSGISITSSISPRC